LGGVDVGVVETCLREDTARVVHLPLSWLLRVGYAKLGGDRAPAILVDQGGTHYQSVYYWTISCETSRSRSLSTRLAFLRVHLCAYLCIEHFRIYRINAARLGARVARLKEKIAQECGE